jgi:flagellar protein FliS
MTIPQIYLERSISTADPARLVAALYDGVLVAVDKAEEFLSSGAAHSLEDAHNELIRAQKIITELRFCLDHTRGGTVAQSLDLLYDHCLGHLMKANLSKDPTGLGHVRKVIAELRDAWEKACCPGTQQVPVAVRAANQAATA